ncbi:MAG TPA: EAL domain-containing protein, partial [Spirochaetia bacterium]|nr:EAL domain-containing protein [Spirochaetia bacterium]
ESFMDADTALKQAKLSHRRSVQFDPANGATRDTLDNAATLRKIHWALEHDRVYPVFQPIMDLRTGEIGKYECLIRVDDEDNNTLLPTQFIEVSKKTGLYQLLTFRMIEKSIAAFRHNKGDFSVNLTIEDLANEETMRFLLGQVRRSGMARRLIVEIVETEELEDYESANLALDELRAAGIRIAIDDFGSGYSSFEYLLKLSPTFIKIDRSIVSQLEAEPRAVQLTRSIVDFAKTSGMLTVAEFIDSERVLDLVKTLGVDYAQGWSIGRASPQLVRRGPANP